MSQHATQTTQSRGLGGARIAALVSAGLIALVSLGLLTAGGWGLFGDSGKDDQGFFSSGYERYATTTHAVTTENLDMDLDGPIGLLDEGLFGTLRLEAQSRDDKPVFVGIARTRDVDAYLAGAARDVVTDLEFSPFEVDYDRVAGERRPRAPRAQDFWAASAHGRGTQTLSWDVADGDWSVLVMNAGGSAGVDARIDTGVKLPWLTPLAWSLLGAGLVGILISGLITALAVRPRRSSEERATLVAA